MMTDTEVANVVFNETRSLWGPEIMQARINIAHAIFNNIERGEIEEMAWRGVRVPDAERKAYVECVMAVSLAREERNGGKDPTKGALHFNFRRNAWRGDFYGAEICTQLGPFTNSYPTQELPANGIYANTYRPKQAI